MKKSNLKKLIKPVIRECLAEIFMEINLETIVEGVVNRQARTQVPMQAESSFVLSETKAPSAPSPEQRKADMMDKLGISEDEWKSIYSDTAESDNPIIADEGATNPEHVSESVLRKSGLYKDYSKFV